MAAIGVPDTTVYPLPLAGAHALVTGGGTGIGLATASVLTAAGARVTVVGRREAVLRSALRSGAAAFCAAADLTNPHAAQAAVSAATNSLGPVQLLVNAAGSAESAPFGKTDAAMFERMWRVNVITAVTTTRLLLPAMLAAGFGRVVNIASTASLKGYRYVTAYSAAKHGLLGFTRALAQEVAGTGVTVNAICPGFTDTDLVAGSIARIVAKTGRSEAEVRSELARGNPMGRLVRPQEVASSVLYLCMPGSDAVNGQALAVDGGET